MKAIEQRWLIIFLLALTCQLSDSADTSPPVMCVTTGTFTVGSRAFITCIFNRDISGSQKYNFNVVQYTNSGTGSGNNVLMCNWLRNVDKTCKVSDGYSYNQVVTDRLTVEIPRVSRSHGGQYACRIVPADGIPVQTCDLDVKEAPITTTVNPASSPMCEPADSAGVFKVAAIILGVLFLLAVVLLIGLIVYSRKRYPLLFTNMKKDMARLNCGRAAYAPSEARHNDVDSVAGLEDKDDGPLSSLLKDDEPLCSPAGEERLSLLLPAGSVSMFGTVLGDNVVDRGEQASVDMSTRDTQTELRRDQLSTDKWTAEHVKEWLMEQAVEKYKGLIDMRITGETLLTLDTEQAIANLGVSYTYLKNNVPTLLNKILALKQKHEGYLAGSKMERHG